MKIDNKRIEFAEITKYDEPIGNGKQAFIYKAMIVDSDDEQKFVAIKKYKPEIIKGRELAIEQHLKRLINFKKRLEDKTIHHVINNYTAWPLEVIYENNKACGFTMSLIQDKFYVGDKKIESSFDFILNDDETRQRLGLPIINSIGRKKIADDLLYIISSMHECNTCQFIYGDLSAGNILVYIDAENQRNNSVVLLESDSFRKATEIHPLMQAHSPDWYPPECTLAQNKRIELEKRNSDINDIINYKVTEFIQSTRTDVYKVCLAILRLYHKGASRAILHKSDIAIENLRNEVSDEFATLVLSGLSNNPYERPKARDLLNCL